MNYEQRIVELKAKGFNVEEMAIIIENEAKDERTLKIGEARAKQGNQAKSFGSKEDWDNASASDKQKQLLLKHHVPHPENVTRKEASVLLDKLAKNNWKWVSE